MVIHLAEELDVPLRERNALLVAAGYAPVYQETPLEGDDMATVRETLRQLLTSHEPNPALVVDRHWNLVLANRAIGLMMTGVSPGAADPTGERTCESRCIPTAWPPASATSRSWSGHLLSRLAREVTATGDPGLAALYDELRTFPGRAKGTRRSRRRRCEPAHGHPAAENPPLGDLVFFSTVATFGTAVDITLAELSIESFFPADASTAAALRAAVGLKKATRSHSPQSQPGGARTPGRLGILL